MHNLSITFVEGGLISEERGVFFTKKQDVDFSRFAY